MKRTQLPNTPSSMETLEDRHQILEAQKNRILVGGAIGAFFFPFTSDMLCLHQSGLYIHVVDWPMG